MKLRFRWQRIGLVCLDAILVALSLYAGYQLRFNFSVFPSDYNQYLLVVPIFIVVRLLFFWNFKLYHGLLRYASIGELVAIFLSITLGSVILSAANALVIPFVPAMENLPEYEGHLQRVPWPVVIIEYVVTMLLVGGARFSRRILVSEVINRSAADDLRRVLIVGAGDAGEAAFRQMRHALVRTYRVVAFVDDDRQKQGHRLHGVPVAGATSDILDVIKRYDVQEVLIAIPRVRPEKLREIVSSCEHARVAFKILPSISDVVSGRVSISDIRPVEIEDLLGREEVRIELPDDRNYLRGQVVMITGAGGSIGSELCRQILQFHPEKVVVFGHGENSVYEIISELNSPGESKLVPVIGDIRDASKVESVAREFRPSIFFHAAAHKHVPLMESNPEEAVKNNVTGTLNVVRAANAIGAGKFILISSDKAVRPTSIMGATKRVSEMIAFCMARQTQTQIVAVRFGNVLGSRGSVIPLFKRQIARGGPVTITHPEVTRFFMTIPEAVSLVIQAGSMQEQRRLFLLDMGQPIKIADLACNLIRLSGFEPDEDIRIEYTGMRPGEKLKEELLTAGENVKATGIGKIFATEPDDVSCDQLWKDIVELEQLAEANARESIRSKLCEMVPDCRFSEAGGAIEPDIAPDLVQG